MAAWRGAPQASPGVRDIACVVPKDGVHHGGLKVPRNDLRLRLLIRALLHERLRGTAMLSNHPALHAAMSWARESHHGITQDWRIC